MPFSGSLFLILRDSRCILELEDSMHGRGRGIVITAGRQRLPPQYAAFVQRLDLEPRRNSARARTALPL
jgi:hypothetical protein